jgi:hypothetical protein
MKSWQFGAATLAILSSLASAKTASDTMVPAQKIPWVVEAPGQPQRLGKLWGDRAIGPAGTLLKVPGGFVAPVHMHTADYRAVVIEGTWKHWPERGSKDKAAALRPGSYWTQKARLWHADACVSKTSCTILLINTDPYKTVLKSAQ